MGILFVDQQQDYILTHAHVNIQQDSSCNKERRSTNDQDQSNNSGGGESGCSTVLEFWRKFDTCDVNDYMLDVSFSTIHHFIRICTGRGVLKHFRLCLFGVGVNNFGGFKKNVCSGMDFLWLYRWGHF